MQNLLHTNNVAIEPDKCRLRLTIFTLFESVHSIYDVYLVRMADTLVSVGGSNGQIYKIIFNLLGFIRTESVRIPNG